MLIDDVPCIACRGKGDTYCERCEGEGVELLKTDPISVVGRTEYDVLAAARLARQGSWPVSGGWLEQVASLVRAVRYVWDVEDMEQAKLRIWQP